MSMKLAVWTPLPPQRSGIADYSYGLLAELAKRAEVVAVVRDGARSPALAPKGVEVVMKSAYNPRSTQLDIYHFGNHSRFHGYMYEAICRRPGILVLHDPALPDFHYDLCGGYDSLLFRDEAHFDDPGSDTAYPVRYVDDHVEVDWLRLPLARRLVEASALTIVHSAWARDAFAARYPRATIVHRHHATPVGGRSTRAPDDGAVTFGTFGGISRPKRTAQVLHAFATVRRETPRARLIICGRADGGGLLADETRAAIARARLAGSVTLRIDAPADEMTRLIGACDAVVALRWPTVGETSGPMMRAFGIGRVVITSDVPQNREIDPRFCWRVPVDAGEDAALAQRMRDVVADPRSVHAAGAIAREFIRREASFAVVAAQHLELAEQLIDGTRR
ncbi:MAG: glycosyltransferase family 4 protein [Acidimicrobiales bacterium]|jgi:glycosyltransferase involved in cell wall biosynthesis